MNLRPHTLFAVCASVLLVQACKKDKTDDKITDDKFSEQIQNIVPDSLITIFRNAGIEINEGKTPPVIEGIYQANPMNTLYDNSGTAGSSISDYKYRFYNQDNQNLSVKLDYKAIGYPDAATGAGAFLSGANNKFTAFVQSNGTSNGISYTLLSVYSGEFTSQGIAGFKQAVYLKQKGSDPNNALAPVGTLRIYEDGNNLAETTSTF